MREFSENNNIDLAILIDGFVQYLSTRNLYNEASIQHELGYFLRKEFEHKYSNNTMCIEFERNVKGIIKEKAHEFIKKEIDLFISSQDDYKCAIELKYVCKKNGRIPENMFDFCKDVKFLEQMKEKEFDNCYFFAVAEKKSNFNCGNCQDGIYKIFRQDKIINGCIQKPTGKKNKKLEIKGSYKINWKDLNEDWEYLLIQV